MELPKRAFAMIPISEVFERVRGKLSELLGEPKNHGAKGNLSADHAAFLLRHRGIDVDHESVWPIVRA
jgi:hypothetical protein